MKKNIYITSLLCGWMAFATTSCEDPGEVHFDDDSFSSTLYLKDNGLQEVDFYNVNKDLIFSTIVGKGGTDNDIARTAAVRLFTQEEMDAYNKLIGSDYVLLPSDCYEFNQQYAFEAGVESQPLDITLKAAIGELDQDQEYVLPVKLISETHSVNPNKCDLIIKPKVITPQVSMSDIGIQTPLKVHTSNTYLQQATFTTSLKLNMPNEGWKFKVHPETDEDILHFLVDQYSIETGKIHKLLPTSAYNIPVVEFAETERSQKLDITVKYQEGMTDGDYLLPIILKEVEGMPFEVNAGTCYLPISLTDGMIQIKPTDSDITTNSSPKTIGKLIDGGVGEGLFWESYYYTVEGLESYCDPTYGIYVDISNLDKKKTKAMKIRLSAYAWHTLATKAKVYAKTVSNPEWTLIKTNDDAEEIAPVFPNAKKKTNYLLELDGGHIRDLDYQDCGEVTAVRIAFLESKKGTLTDITAANVGSKLVGLAEIEIFGY